MNKLILGMPVLLLLVACGGSVEIGASAGSSSGSGSTGAGGAGSSSSGAGGMDVGCGLSAGKLVTTLMPYNGPPPACDMMGNMPVVWTGTGAVVKSDAGTLVIDQCPPTADCVPFITTLTAAADKLALSIPIGAYVKVSYALDPSWMSCTQRILIENVPTWDGTPNPVSASNRIYLVGAEGEVASFDSVPFVVDQKALGCSDEPGCGGIQPDSYALFAAGTLIGMGQSKALNAKGRKFVFHNLRSYQTTNCDDYWNWAFWAVED